MFRHMTCLPSERVSEEIRAHLARKRISGSELARRLGRPQSSIARRLSGQTPWDVNELSDVAGVLGLDPGELLPMVAAIADTEERQRVRVP